MKAEGGSKTKGLVSHEFDNTSFRVANSSFPPPSRPTWAEVDLDNLVHNLRVTRQAIGPGVAIMPAVKADAYGHGGVECARALEAAGADWFGVALPEEGVVLRKAGIRRPILSLAGFWEGQEELVVKNEITPAVFRLEILDALDRAARAANRTVDYHLKIDTGMGRLGLPFGCLATFLQRAGRYTNVRLDGVMTHLASADCPEQVELTRRQMMLFAEAVETVRKHGHNPTWIHHANSAATHARPRALDNAFDNALDNALDNMVRLGGILYGLWGDVTDASVPPLDWRPVMSLRTRVMFVKAVPPGATLGYGATFVTKRESNIATLPIGYDDGLRRSLSNRGRVIIRNRFAPIVGRVSMDLTMIDVTGIPEVIVGDEVVIFGRQGDATITAEEVAAQAGTLSYEVTCGIGARVPRLYRSGSAGCD